MAIYGTAQSKGGIGRGVHISLPPHGHICACVVLSNCVRAIQNMAEITDMQDLSGHNYSQSQQIIVNHVTQSRSSEVKF